VFGVPGWSWVDEWGMVGSVRCVEGTDIGRGNSAKCAEHLGALGSFTSDPARYKDAMSRQGSVRWLRSQELPPQ